MESQGFVAIWLDVFNNRYMDFSGRARRKEFWSFTLVNCVIGFVLGIVSAIPKIGWIFTIITLLFQLALLLPGIAVGVRRLHDTGRSGWLQLLCLIPFLGALILIVFYVLPGDSGSNDYGDDPKADD